MVKVTLEKLAQMINKGFETVLTKKEFEEYKKETKTEFLGLGKRMDKIDTKLNNIVYRNEFEKLESKVKEIENILNGAGIKV